MIDVICENGKILLISKSPGSCRSNVFRAHLKNERQVTPVVIFLQNIEESIFWSLVTSYYIETLSIMIFTVDIPYKN